MTELQRRTEAQLLQTARYFFDEAANRLGLELSLRELLRYPKRKFIVVFPVVMDDKRVESFEGYRVQHHLVLGPCKGGIRYHPDVTLEEIEALAILATWESALLELPFSGAKGGLRCDPKRLSVTELERLTRRYVAEIAPLLAPQTDIPEPDLYTSEREMAWLLDTLSMHEHGQYRAASVTGKPLVLSGSFGREQATGRGAFFIALEVLKTLGLSPQETSVAIQGFGHSGKSFAHFMHGAGARLIAVSDSRGGVFHPDGLDIPKLLQHKQEMGTVLGFANSLPISNAELLTLPCELLAPAAIENQITAENAGSIKAQAVLELAYGPTTLEADRILYDRDIIVVPDILVNAGGATVGYFEWVQSQTFDFWSPAQVEDRLKRFMRRAFRRVQAACAAENTDLRTAAYCVAVKRVANAARARGLYA